MKPDVVAVGEAMAALRSTGRISLGASFELSVAGAEANVAIGLSRLGHRAAWVGRVGDDAFGELVLRTLRAEGVDLGNADVDTEGRPTGLLFREQRIGDLSRVSYRRAGSAGSALRAEDVLTALHPGLRVLHLTGITPALGADAADAVAAAAVRARELGASVCLDVNFRAALWDADRARRVLAPLARHADVLIASADELPLVAGASSGSEQATAAELLAGGCREVVVTRGGDGASVTTADGALHEPARRVPVVDVVGAGDAFAAGYLSGYLDGLDVPGRLQRALTTGAFAVATRGDWEGLPTRGELGLLDHPDGTTLR